MEKGHAETMSHQQTTQDRLKELEEEVAVVRKAMERLRGDVLYFIKRVEDGTAYSKTTYARYLESYQATKHL